MSRPLRLEFDHATYHVTSRGDRREDIYEDDEDRLVFLELLGQVVGWFNWVCHGYCLMDNHYHLLIETPDGNLSKGMLQLNDVYTQKSNRRRQRSDHLFQDRYKAILVDADTYLLELTRYVVWLSRRLTGPGVAIEPWWVRFLLLNGWQRMVCFHSLVISGKLPLSNTFSWLLKASVANRFGQI